MNHHAVPRYYHIDVDLVPERVGQVRRILAAHLRYWGLEQHVPDVSRGLGLLLEPAARNTCAVRTAIETWWTGQHLITAVSHGAPAAAGEHRAEPHHLSQIAALSDGWGSCTAADQHIVWFSLRSRTELREPLVPKRPGPITIEARPLPRAVAQPVGVGAPEHVGPLEVAEPA
ncbi:MULTISPECIES: pep a2 [unclassified Streptomyces]|uniref:pep a2 n=1 Tax=unclassified Streptomyces TaxID=2593676 RepID=UPI00332CEBD1